MTEISEIYPGHYQVPLSELESRMLRFRNQMTANDPFWEMAVIFSKINLFYFTGTMQEGMLFIPRSSNAVLWVRRSFERAVNESLFPVIMPMESFRDASETFNQLPDSIHMELEIVPIAHLRRFQKYFPIQEIKSADQSIAQTRAVKSLYELTLMKEAGKVHQKVLEEKAPNLLKEGISEAEFGATLFSLMVKEGHQGIARFGMFDTEMILGHVAFGESSIYPTSFNGPGGNYGMSPAVPMLGSHKRRLRKGDLVFVDVGCGIQGYHTDKTMTYVFEGSLKPEAVSAHHKCVDIQYQIAEMLKPGAIPSEIYAKVMNGLSPEFLDNFMGFGKRQVKFLGHGIGLTIDEWPVIASGFNEPLQEGMVLAVEPKKGIPGIGMVGIENTFMITPAGGICITGNNPGLIKIKGCPD